MTQFARHRLLFAAAAIVAIAALATWLIDWGAAIGALAGGFVVIALFVRSHAPAPAEPAAASLIETIAAPVLVVAGNRVAEANAAARALLGAHILGEDVRLAVRHPAATERLADPRGDVEGEGVALIGLGGRDQHWELRASPVERGRRVVQLIDRTRSYAAERMRVDFVASASHELKTPLASLLGYIETLSEPAAGGEPRLRDRFLGIMAGETARMRNLVDDLLSLSRIEADKYAAPTASIDLAELAGTVVGDIRASGGPRSADLAIDIAADLPPLPGDRAQLSQLLHNLIGNAMQYGRAGTPVTISIAAPKPGAVRIVVADQGEGVAPEHVARLTERFYRVDPGRSRSLGGTGLGLAIVKHVVERHRGRLDIASVRGIGTTVTVVLPTAGDAALSSNRHDSAASAVSAEPANSARDADPADPDIGELRGLIAEMGGLAEAAIHASVDALARHDLAGARRVIAGDKRIDLLESQVERLAVRLIARRSPTGGDLREAVAALKIAALVERIGDYAKNIAKRVAAIDGGKAIEPVAMLPAMARMAGDLVHDGLDAFATRDAAAAIDVAGRDRAIDDVYDSLFRLLVAWMAEHPDSIGQVAHLLFVAKNLERIGDHATNVAEMVHFAATGAHMPERARGASPIPAI